MAKNNRSSKRHRDIKDTRRYYKTKFKWYNFCVYCGQPQDCLDHVFPVSAAAGLDLNRPGVIAELGQGLNLVPCCNSCNHIASDKRFTNIRLKREYIQHRIYELNSKYLRTVEWSEDELVELGFNMRQQIAQMQHNRKVIENRINYPYFKRV